MVGHEQAPASMEQRTLDRELWLAIRRALLMLVAAIEKRWNIDSAR
jgi:hypothetical protein